MIDIGWGICFLGCGGMILVGLIVLVIDNIITNAMKARRYNKMTPEERLKHAELEMIKAIVDGDDDD